MGIKLTPRGKNILVRLDKVEEKKTEGGIWVADKHSEETRIGTVLQCGQDVDSGITPGTKVLISFYVGVVVHLPEIGILDDTYRFITESEILSFVGD